MQVKGKVHIEFNDYRCHELTMHVKFKLPNQWFTKTRSKRLADSWWIGDVYKDWDEFWNYCYEVLNDKEYIVKEAKELIIGYIKEKYKDTETDKHKIKINKLIKELNKNFEVEVEYEVTK